MKKKKPSALAPDRLIGRRVGKLSPRPGVYIFSEGSVTEPEYIQEFYRERCNHKKIVLFPIVRGAGAPMTIVEACIAKIKELKKASKVDSFEENTTVWAVFDVDAHPNISEAIEKADAAGVRYTISNPCIEVWGLMHEQIYERPSSRHEAQVALTRVMPGYHHDKSPVFSWKYCRERIVDAILNSEAALKRREEDGNPHPTGNPTTNFQDLLLELEGRDIEELREEKKAQRQRKAQ